MTEVSFHFNIPPGPQYACRLLRKAVGQGAKVAVTGEPSLLKELDVALWTFSALDFVAHCDGATATAGLAERSPVVLVPTADQASHAQVLLNLSGPVPAGFERFARLIELVDGDPARMEQARVRFKHYAGRGYAIARHDAAVQEAR